MKLGDKIEAVTKATGIKAAVDFFAEMLGVDCGCEERKEKFNKLFKGGEKPKSMTAEMYEEARAAISGISTTISPKQQVKIATVYADVFQTRYELWCVACGRVWKRKIKELQNAVKFYEINQRNEGANVQNDTNSDTGKKSTKPGGRRKAGTNTKSAGSVVGGRGKGGNTGKAKAVDEGTTGSESGGGGGGKIEIQPRHK